MSSAIWDANSGIAAAVQNYTGFWTGLHFRFVGNCLHLFTRHYVEPKDGVRIETNGGLIPGVKTR